MARFAQIVLLVVTVASLAALTPRPALAQLQTLSKGNADLQWRDAQLKVLDTQLADAALPAELKLELEAQRTWLAKWNPKKTVASEPASEPASEADKGEASPVQKEPNIDPEELAGKLRNALFNSKTPPTVEDTNALQTALTAHSGDIGLRQLQMHWIDQARYRNDYWKEIGDACDRVISLAESLEPTEEVKLAVAFAYYRKARALAHALRALAMKSDSVAGVGKLSPEDLKSLQDSIGECARQVDKLVGPGRPEFFQLEMYALRRDRWSGRALELLEKYSASVDPSAYLAEKRSLLEAMGWKGPSSQTANALAGFAADQRRTLEIQYAP